VLQGRFTGLTIVLLILSFFATNVGQKHIRELLGSLGFSVLLLFAIRTVGPRLRIVTVTLALPPLIGLWIPLSDWPVLHVVVLALASCFLAFLTLVIVHAVFRDQAVTADTIVGAVCGYFLLGVTWGTFYALLVSVSPGALSISPALVSAAGWGFPIAPFTPFLQYYSFSTLATLGYGDVTPLTSGARSLSVLEGLTGQLYLAVLIARLVGMHAARHGRE